MVNMNANLLNLIGSFADRKLLVIGEAMLDSYMEGTAERLCREAPVPVVAINERIYVPGGAANAAVNVRSLGGEVVFLSVTGDDAEGDLLRQSLEERGVSTEQLLSLPQRRTLSKQRIIAASQMVVRFDQGSTNPLQSETEQVFIQRLQSLFFECDAVIVSDYGYGIVTPRVIEALAELQRKDPHLVVVDSRRPKAFHSINITAIKPNYEEALRLLGLKKVCDDAERVHQMEEQGRKILDFTGAQIAAVTLDHKGALIFHHGDDTPYRTYAKPEPNSRAAGAGDTFVSALTLSLASGAHVENAAELASAAASIVVSKDGTAACFAEELRDRFSTSEKFVTDVFQLAARVASYRRAGRRIVFTNGCFDILHRGHITYLNRAKALGDVLIVGLNSDDSVRRLKGPNRPINSLEDRAQILAALSCIDHIVSFNSDTPRELIRVIRPDIFVKGGDYSRQTLPEASLVEELGGEVEILPYLENHSTTSIIERIRNIYAE
jgi:D-beta-D-heptose 7-phosphate kinase/D-beta-D-heptose 1-phosphate adenosyltransferase